jgi:hypothetical protein
LRFLFAFEQRQERFHHTSDGPEIDLKEPIELFESDLFKGSTEGDTGAIKEKSEAAVPGFDGGGEGGDGLGVGDIENVLGDLDASGAGGGGILSEWFGVAIGEREMTTAPSQIEGDGSANASCRSGNHSHSIFERQRRLARHLR